MITVFPDKATRNKHNDFNIYGLTWVNGAVDLHRHTDTGCSISGDTQRQILFAFCGRTTNKSPLTDSASRDISHNAR